jgi:hypothetical protein
MPSAKNSCAGSSLIFVKGKTAIEGLSGSSKVVAAGTDDIGASSTVNAHRPAKVFQRLLAIITKFGLDLALHLAERVLRDANPAWFGDTLKACREIDAIADDIVAIDQSVAG